MPSSSIRATTIDAWEGSLQPGSPASDETLSAGTGDTCCRTRVRRTAIRTLAPKRRGTCRTPGASRTPGWLRAQLGARAIKINKAVLGKLATLLLELAYMGSRQPKQYHRRQQAYEENQHGRPAELAHQIIQTNSATGPRLESARRLSLGGVRDQIHRL